MLQRKACDIMTDSRIGDFLAAVGLVHECSVSVGSDAPSAAHVRAARHLVHQLASNELYGN